jgi:uncharacterized delta-60 repeat protein
MFVRRVVSISIPALLLIASDGPVGPSIPTVVPLALEARLLASVDEPPHPGDLDATFGQAGKVLTDLTVLGGANPAGVVVQPDGKILIAGTVSQDLAVGDFAIARYLTDGTPDPLFGANGKVTTDFGEYDAASSEVLQPDGKVVAGGVAYVNGDTRFALARYNDDGTLDATFGVGGKVMADVGCHGAIFGLALQTDGKLVAGGSCLPQGDFLLARYNANGSLDSTFGSGGTVITDIDGDFDTVAGVAVQVDGSIVAAGRALVNEGQDSVFALVRYSPGGSLDSSFGTGGKVTTDFGPGYEDGAEALVIQPDGRIVAVGHAVVADSPSGADDFALCRYNVDGSLDVGFGTGGKVTTGFGSYDYAFAVALQPDGKILAAGRAEILGDRRFALARYDPSGALDDTFGTGGTVTTSFGGFGQARGLALQSDGKIVAAGLTAATSEAYVFALARYWGDSAIDDSDGDGIPDLGDQCPSEDATGFDADNNGCIDTIGGLVEVIDALFAEGAISSDLQTSVISKVQNSQMSSTDENICAAVHELEALENQISAQVGKKISPEAALLIINYADSVIAQLLPKLSAGAKC